VAAEGHLEEIRRLRELVDQSSGVAAAQEAAVPLWLTVVGPGIESDSAPTSVLTAILDAFRKGIQSIAEVVLTGDLATRPTAALNRSADFRIMALASGSLRIGVRWPQDEGDTAAAAVSEAIDDYLRAAAWLSSSEEAAGLEASIPDERRRRLVLNELARLVPRERGQVERVEISGERMRRARLPERVTLSRQARSRIGRALDLTLQHRGEVRVGDLREIDLDNGSLVLRNIEGGEGLTVNCVFPEDLRDAAKDALDKRVRVTGSRPAPEGRRARPLTISRLEIIEER
jgi:hypothetical protein